MQPLPSDAIFREDIKVFKTKDLELAQGEKVRLEILQRADRAKRLEYSKKMKEAHKEKPSK